VFDYSRLRILLPNGMIGGILLRGDMKQFYIIYPQLGAFAARYFVYSGEFQPSRLS
jgi:hypothetical protein